MNAESHSTSGLLTALLDGQAVKGVVCGPHELQFGDYVVVFTPPGTPRMPNGLECRVKIRPGARASIGGGGLVVGGTEIAPGPGWSPVPAFVPFPCLPPGLEPSTGSPARCEEATGAASGATLAGYVAGLVLLHGHRTRAERVASRAIALLDPLWATLLRHAERGEVPETVHEVLRSGDTSRLTSSSPLGIAWLRGLVSAGLPLDLVSARVVPKRQTA